MLIIVSGIEKYFKIMIILETFCDVFILCLRNMEFDSTLKNWNLLILFLKFVGYKIFK